MRPRINRNRSSELVSSTVFAKRKGIKFPEVLKITLTKSERFDGLWAKFIQLCKK